jgi:hypothetical protein
MFSTLSLGGTFCDGADIQSHGRLFFKNYSLHFLNAVRLRSEQANITAIAE